MHQLVPQFILDKVAQQESAGELEAVCLFVDTSGFTPLTSALMRHGKAGAEVLAQALSDVFDPLVQTVYAHGGFIAGFAGDAFKAVFPLKDDAFARAFSAAVQIRQHMQQHVTHTTRYGTFDLVVKQSMAVGTVTWSIWPPLAAGSSSETAVQHHAYTFAGTALAACMAADAHATAHDLILTRAIYQRLIGAVTLSVEPIDEAFVRVLEIGEWHRASAANPQSVSQTHSTAPQTLFFADDLLNLSVKGEFRQVVSMFVNIQSLVDGPETADFQRQLFRLLARYGGYLCRVGQIGDRDAGATLLLFWGAPTSYENDVIRALNFILDLRVICPAPMRAGISTNLAFAGFAGGQQREEYTCYGSYVTLAARQMVTADWGEIWLDEETARLGKQEFEARRLGQRPFKGFEQPRTVFELRGRRVMTTTAFYSGQMTGRREELEKIQTALEPLWNKRFAGAVAVYGEAGIGKSRLIHEASEQIVSGVMKPIWLLCQTDEIIRQSLNPFRYMLRRYFNQDDTKTDVENKRQFASRVNALAVRVRDHTIRAELQRTYSFLGALLNLHWPNSLYDKLEPALRLENTQAALKNFIKALSLHRPVIIHLEDAHWLDEESGKFLQLLTRNVADFPFALVLSSRTAVSQELVAAQVPWQAIGLRPLSPEELGHAAASFLQQPVAPSLLPLLQAKTDGNPFFLEQLLLYWQENDHFRTSDEGLVLQQTAEAVPGDVRQVLIARLDRLIQEVKEVVQAASVLGREFEMQVLAQLLAEDTKLPTKVRLAEAEAIWTAISTVRYLFRHALLRDAAYDMQLLTHLRQLHLLAARAITAVFAPELSPHAADLAYHYDRAERGDEAVRWYRIAGEQAIAQYANEEALRYLSEAIRLTRPPERFDLLLLRVRIYNLLGKREEEAQDLRALVELSAGRPEREIEIALRQADHAEAVSDYTVAATASQRVVALAQQQQNVAKQADGALRWSRALLGQGAYDMALTQLDTALQRFRQIEDKRGEANVLNELGKLYFERGEYEQADRYYQQALPMHQELDNQRGEHLTLKNLGSINLYQGDFARAKTYYELGLKICREIGDRRGEGMLITNLGGVYHYQGQYQQALRFYNQDLHICREIGDRLGEGIVLINLGLLHHDLTLFADTLTLTKEAAPIVVEVGSRFIEGYVYSVLGHGYAGMEEWQTAVSAYEIALAIRRELDQPYLAMDVLAGLARVAYAQGDIPLAAQHIADILTYLDENPKLDGVEEPVRVLLICYRVLAAQTSPRAEPVLQTAYDLLQERAAKISDVALRHSFLENVKPHREVIEAIRSIEQRG